MRPSILITQQQDLDASTDTGAAAASSSAEYERSANQRRFTDFFDADVRKKSPLQSLGRIYFALDANVHAA